MYTRKYKFESFIVMFFLTVNVTAQEGWLMQNSGTSNHLYSVCFVNKDTGWVVGGSYDKSSIILKTTDGGSNWYPQNSGTNDCLYSVHFIDAKTGWAVGGDDWGPEDQNILHTNDGGLNWTIQYDHPHVILYSVFFTDADTGWVVGADYTMVPAIHFILHTTDGGKNWVQQGYYHITPPPHLLVV